MGHLRIKRWPWVARWPGGQLARPFLQTGRKWPFGPPHEPSRRSGRECRRSSNRGVGCRSRASPTVRSGGGYFNARIADSDSVNHGSNPGPSARESASNRCVFVVSSLAGIVLKLPRVSYPANPSATTRDAKCLGAGREAAGSLEADTDVLTCVKAPDAAGIVPMHAGRANG